MGSRPSSTFAGSNGTMTDETETYLRTENTQLKEKLSALEELDPIRIKQENEELRGKNKELTDQLDVLRISKPPPRHSVTDCTEYHHNSTSTNCDTKDKERSTRKITANLAPHKLSDIDAYGQGIPLEKHHPIKIKSHRKRPRKKEPSERCSDSKQIDMSIDITKVVNNNDIIDTIDTIGGLTRTPEIEAVIGQEQDISAQPEIVDNNGDNKSFKESDLLS